jgi:hypothetical protein
MSNQQQNDSYYLDEMIRKVCLINTYLSYDAKEVHFSTISVNNNTLSTSSTAINFDPKTHRVIGLINNLETSVEGQNLGIYGLKLFPAIDVDEKGNPYTYYESSRFKNKLYTKYSILVRRLQSNKKFHTALTTNLTKMKSDSKKYKRTNDKIISLSKFIAEAEKTLKDLETAIKDVNDKNINLSGQKINFQNKSELKYYDFTTINSSVQYLTVSGNPNENADLNYFKNEKLLGGSLMQKVVKKITSGTNSYELILAIRPQTDDGYVNNIELSVKSGSQNYLLGMMRLDFTDLCKFLFSSDVNQMEFIKNNIKNLMGNFGSTSDDKDQFWYKSIKKNDFTNHVYTDDTYKQLSSCLLYLFMLMFQPFDVSSTKNFTHQFHPLIVPKRSLLKNYDDYVSNFGVPVSMIDANLDKNLVSTCARTIMYNSTFNPIFIKNSMNDFFKANFTDLKKQIPNAKPGEKRKLMKRKIIYGRLGRMSSQVSYTNAIHSVKGTISFGSKSRKNKRFGKKKTNTKTPVK